MILDEIIKNKRKEIADIKIRCGLENLNKPKNFLKAISKKGMNLIAEIKRKSPSTGVIIKISDIQKIVSTYEKAGASAISVLTDSKYFGGSIDDLKKIRKLTKLPILRKDFIISEKQIYEARIAGADAILLIVRILSGKKLAAFLKLAEKLGLFSLVEIHDKKDLKKALKTGAKIIGINNRNLQTFKLDLNTTLELAKKIPKSKIIVSESGIITRKDVTILEKANINAILVGSSLLKSKSISKKITELLGK